MVTKKSHLAAITAAAAVVASLGATSIRADLIDVNFYSASFGGGTASGAAVVGNSSDIWNGINGDTSSGSMDNLMDVAGDSTPVEIAWIAAGAVIPLASNIQPNPSLMYDYLYNTNTTEINNGDITVTLSGLAPETQYDLYLYVASNDASDYDRAVALTVDSSIGGAGGNPQTTFIDGQNYKLLTPTSDNLGDLSVTESPQALGLINTSGEVDLNGLQIRPVPEPASLAFMGLGSVALLYKQRKKNADIKAGVR